MLTDRDLDLIDDILDAISRVGKYIGVMSYPEFLEDTLTQDAVLHNVQIIGEAVSKLSKEFKGQVTEIDWEDSVKMRHIIVHDYGRVRLDIVWDAVKHDLPQLEAALKPWQTEIE